MDRLAEFAYGFWALGTFVLLAGLAYAVIAYRRRAGLRQRELEKRPPVVPPS